MKSCLPFLIFFILSFSSMGQKLVDVSAEYGIFGVEQDGYASGNSFVDFDQDGDDDITTGSNIGTEIMFYRNDGTEFTHLSLNDNIEGQRQINWVDFDNDKDLDLQITSSTSVRLFENTGDLNLVDITEQSGIETQPSNVDGVSYPSCWSDYDEDGLLDLLLTFRSFDTLKSIRLYKNNGDKTFSDVTNQVGIDDNLGSTPLAAGFMDIDNDNFEDIIVIQDYGGGHILLRNDQNGKFIDLSETISTGNYAEDGMTASFGDLNFDGLMDLYVTNTNRDAFYQNFGAANMIENSVFYGLDNDRFTFGATFFDIDCDTDLDLFVANIGLYMNGEIIDSYFEPDDDVLSFNSRTLTAIIAGDFNDDGYPDLIGNRNMNTALYQNNYQSNNWLKINAQGNESNYFAVGTRLILEVAGKKLIRHIQCGQGFCSQQSYTQYFGLAENQVAEKLTIIWPNGLQEEYTNLDANTHYKFIEGVGYQIDLKYTGFTKVSHCEESMNPTIISAQSSNPPYIYTLLNEQNEIMQGGQLLNQFQKDTIYLDNGIYKIKIEDSLGVEDLDSFKIFHKNYIPKANILSVEHIGYNCEKTKGIYDIAIEIEPALVSFNWQYPINEYDYRYENNILQFTNLETEFNPYELIINIACESRSLIFDFDNVSLDPIGVEIEVTEATSNTNSDGSISATPSYGIPPYDYIWWDSTWWPLTDQAILENVPSGTYHLKIEDSLYCTRELSIELDFTSKTKIVNHSDLHISPMPAKDRVKFQFTDLAYLDQVHFFNMNGILVKSIPKIRQNETIDISHLPPGFYILNYTADGQYFTKKLIKQ